MQNYILRDYKNQLRERPTFLETHLTVREENYPLQALHWQRPSRLPTYKSQRHCHLPAEQHPTLDLCLLHRFRLGWRQNYKTFYKWMALFTTRHTIELRQPNTTNCYTFQCRSRIDGFEQRHGRSTTCTTTQLQLLEELQTGMCTTTFSYSNSNKKCITLYTDSTSATSLASKLGVNRRPRHIALRYLWIQDLRQAGEVDIKRDTTHENPADIYTKLLPAPVLQKHLPQNGLLETTRQERGKKSACTTSRTKSHNNKSKNTVDNDNKVFRQDHYNNMHKTVKQYKKQNVELRRQVDDLQQLVGEREMLKLRNLAYKHLLPN